VSSSEKNDIHSATAAPMGLTNNWGPVIKIKSLWMTVSEKKFKDARTPTQTNKTES